MSTKTIDPVALVQEAAAKASVTAQRAPATSNYTDAAGPFETAGGHGDAYITESPSGVRYLEHRPRGGGRVKRVPLIAVAAVFPGILPPPKG